MPGKLRPRFALNVAGPTAVSFAPFGARCRITGRRRRVVCNDEGYNLEHNYGHGEQNLSVVLALLMMLAFLVDQVQQLCCPLFQTAWHKMRTKCHLWEEIRSHFRTLLFGSMAELLTALIRGIAPQRPVFENSS